MKKLNAYYIKKHYILFKKILSWSFKNIIQIKILNNICLNPLIEQDDEDELEEQAFINMQRQQLSSPCQDDFGYEDSLEDEEIEEEDLVDLWVVRNSMEEGTSQFEVLTYENRLNCTNRKLINVSIERIEAIAIYNGNQIWCVDVAKCIYVYW